MFRLPRLTRAGRFSVLILACVIILSSYLVLNKKTNASAAGNTEMKPVHATVNKTPSKQAEKSITKAQAKAKVKAQPVNWLLPTGGSYPVIGPNEPIWIKVSKAQQRLYIMNGNNIIYTMICSTGLDTAPDTSTPVGTYHIQQERGTSFYNPSEGEGAMYWVSWKNHGEFLIHSVATDKNGNIIPSEAEKLGQKASHGCVRLAVPDAKWIYDNIQYGTKVVID